MRGIFQRHSFAPASRKEPAHVHQDKPEITGRSAVDFLSQTGQGNPDWTGLMAAVTISILPILVMLVVF